MQEIFYKILFLILLLLINIIRIAFQSKNNSFKYFNRTKETLSVILFYVSFIIISFLYVFTDYLIPFSLKLHDSIRLLSIIIILAGTYLFYSTHKTLGKYFSPILSLKKDHRLIQSGPYKYIRHPMYTSLYIIIIGFWILSSNLLVGFIPIIMFTILYLTRINNEEKMMIKQFKTQYKKYIKKTGRLLPKIKILS